MEASIWNIQLGDQIPASALCKKLELECQPELLAICSRIEQFLSQYTADEFEDQHIELVLMLFTKIFDELSHLFLKEKGLIYPGIQNKGTEFVLLPAIVKEIQHTQQKITAILVRLRQLLNNFQMKPFWSAAFKNCVQHFYQLETKIHQWIYIEQNLLYPHFIHSTNVN
jgi:iron-sulfur cluster repair protein YtfE (RIC family)